MLLHIAIGVICFAANLVVWGYENKNLILAGYTKFFKKNQ